MVGYLLKLIALPVTGPIQATIFIAEKVAEQAEKELYDEDNVRAQLMELELRYDLGEMEEEVFLQAEEQLLERLKQIRKRKEEDM